jgi:hypothetical protein
MRSSVGDKYPFSGNGERKKPGFLQRATATLAGLALFLGGCSIGEAGAGASSSPEVTATPDTTSTAEAAPTPTADRTPKMVAPGELPTIKQLSMENLEEDECIMYSVGAFKTEEGTMASRPIVTVNGKLTTFGEEVCNGGKVEVGKGDQVRYFALVWGDQPEKTTIKEVFPENGESTIAYTRSDGYTELLNTIQAVGTDSSDVYDWRNVAVLFRLSSDGKYYPVGCEYRGDDDEIDLQTMVNTTSADLGRCRQ